MGVEHHVRQIKMRELEGQLMSWHSQPGATNRILGPAIRSDKNGLLRFRPTRAIALLLLIEAEKL